MPDVERAEFRRPMFDTLRSRLAEPRARIQVLAGPRQTGKTTLVRQVLATLDRPSHYASADQVTGQDRSWLEAQWEIGRIRASVGDLGATLVLDEVQKITAWSGRQAALGCRYRRRRPAAGGAAGLRADAGCARPR